MKAPALAKWNTYKVGFVHGHQYYTYCRQQFIKNTAYYITRATDWQAILAYPFVKLGVPDNWIPRAWMTESQFVYDGEEGEDWEYKSKAENMNKRWRNE